MDVDATLDTAAAAAVAVAANSNPTTCSLFIGSIISMHYGHYHYHGRAVSTSQNYRCSENRFFIH